MIFKKRDRVGETTHAAADLGKEALATAEAYIKQAQEYLAPRVEDALDQAGEYLAPKTEAARKAGARYAASAMDAARPHIDEAYLKVAPKAEAARNRVQDGWLPALATALHNAADDVSAVELPHMPRTVVEKKKSAWATVGQVLLASGLLAAVVFAVKKFLEPTDAGWQAHEPSTPYVPTSTETLVDDLSSPDAPVAEETVIVDDAANAYIADDLSDESVKDDAEGDAAPFAPSPYGDGSYVGAEPPEGFVIKGNERSMKYHVAGNGGYERTIADVWFNSEEAAEAAGFTKAQR